MAETGNIRLLVTCADRTGIIAAVTGFLGDHSGNIVAADQHVDPETGEFFMRLEVEHAGFGLDQPGFAKAFQPVADRLGLRWRLWWGERRRRVAVLVSKEGHCLFDLLYRWKSRELACDIAAVISNHPDHAGAAASMGVPYHHLPVTAATKASQEAQLAALLDELEVDLVVLARYMQILSPALVQQRPAGIINIHHSFLPAFPGPRPYHRAHERGVKIIGATSHYVTQQLDEGPIIAQQTESVGHRHLVSDLVRLGRDLERIVLARAVRLHLEDRILVAGNRTIVFE